MLPLCGLSFSLLPGESCVSALGGLLLPVPRVLVPDMQEVGTGAVRNNIGFCGPLPLLLFLS